MTTPIISWGDEIEPGSKPTFIFPILLQRLHVDLQTRDEFNLTNFMTSSEVGTVTGNTVVEGGSDGFALLSATDTITGRLIGDPVPIDEAVSGQAGNLQLTYSKDGANFIPCVGVGPIELGGSGVYKYTLDSTETDTPGSGFIRVSPVDANALAPAWISTTYLAYRVAKPGPPIVKPVPGTTTIIDPTSLNDIKQYIQQAMNTILNAIQPKPTIRRDQ